MLQLSQAIILLSEAIVPSLGLLLLPLIFGDSNITSLCLQIVFVREKVKVTPSQG